VEWLWGSRDWSASTSAFIGLASFGGDRPTRRWFVRCRAAMRSLPRPVFNATRAVTVNARPEDIWPWLVQIGFGRAGWYSYDVLDNLGRHSSEEILPEYQHLEPGDLIPLGPGAESGLFVKEIRPNESMVWWERKRKSTTWVWGLYPMDGDETRLITRVRNDYRKGLSNFIFGLLLIEPADFPLMRKCVLGIKRRAETQAMHAKTGSV
jgi:hypothetical protein